MSGRESTGLGTGYKLVYNTNGFKAWCQINQ